MCGVVNFEQLISPKLRGRKFVSASFRKLTSSGDNYCSLILAVDVTVKNGTKEEVLHLVAKMLPPNEQIQMMFNSRYTQRNEIGFYEAVIPCLREFQEEQGFEELLNTAPDFYSARLSLDPDAKEADQDTVLLIRNIQEDGFVMLDRRVGFDLEQSEFILDKMAQVHATAIALKLLKPDVFEAKLGPFFQEYTMYKRSDGDDENTAEKFVEIFKKLLIDDAVCVQNFDRLIGLIHSCIQTSGVKNSETGRSTRFATLAHIDVWTNNIMVKIVDGKTVDLKFLDYQIFEHCSAARDVVFFIFSSVQFSVLSQNVDALLAHYHTSFVKYLKKLKCDDSQFTFDAFYEEVKTVPRQFTFLQLFLMLLVIYAENVEEIENLNHDYIYTLEPTKAAKEKACYIAREFMRRDWV